MIWLTQEREIAPYVWVHPDSGADWPRERKRKVPHRSEGKKRRTTADCGVDNLAARLSSA
jgi:hypothetical protein